MPTINDAGRHLIESCEGCVLYAYDDADDKRIEPGEAVTGTLTIGYGHTGTDVHPGESITQDQAVALLDQDLEKFEEGVNDLIAVNLTPNQFAALVSFAYNDGLGALQGSTLLRLVNAGNFQAAAGQFGLWAHDGNGNVVPGLVRRRAAERQLFMTK